MSLEAVQRIIKRAMTDPEFRQALKTDPDAVFTDRNVTPQEIQALKALNWDSLSSTAEDAEVRAYAMNLGLSRISDGCK